MAHVAKTQLLRALMRGTGVAAVVLGLTSPVSAEDEPPVQFAPGATGSLTTPLVDIVREAERRGDELADQLTIQDPTEGVPIADLEGMRAKALSDPRVKRLLGLAEEDGTSEGQGEKYAETRAILFASFSMPPQSLRQMMQEATEHGLTIVFRGFVNNSVFDTRAKLEEVFGADEIGEAFAIDPTLFRRFDILAVPALVVLKESLGTCETPACELDLAPAHDRLSGNIPVETALRIIAAGNGDAADVARALAETKP
ncbi:type-F conjugative transfer system pilin assembly protein TrbC [Paenirhodobacter populi]|uniref:Type-F conjugative transfer system pilin assembly protein TrbC n=1 Tax=Paenirhodobacter populi TaxID=2306993 RepID=A0A443JR23_9RHOB|nr:type-F conjugative transfer system pilin assembly protein TrbC [Sinirhodobacter populi]RWR22951.1 type-F conjugative transfer system pilin assembly protein TrbC [Sinirhodobacter populi]